MYMIFLKRNINFLSKSTLATGYYEQDKGSDKVYPR